jgi:hypothetical protein
MLIRTARENGKGLFVLGREKKRSKGSEQEGKNSGAEYLSCKRKGIFGC